MFSQIDLGPDSEDETDASTLNVPQIGELLKQREELSEVQTKEMASPTPSSGLMPDHIASDTASGSVVIQDSLQVTQEAGKSMSSLPGLCQSSITYSGGAFDDAKLQSSHKSSSSFVQTRSSAAQQGGSEDVLVDNTLGSQSQMSSVLTQDQALFDDDDLQLIEEEGTRRYVEPGLMVLQVRLITSAPPMRMAWVQYNKTWCKVVISGSPGPMLIATAIAEDGPQPQPDTIPLILPNKACELLCAVYYWYCRRRH